MCVRAVPADRYASVIRFWVLLQAVLFVFWVALIPIELGGRAFGVAAFTLPILFMTIFIATPIYFGFGLFISGARDLERGRRRWLWKLALAPILAASLGAFVIVIVADRWSLAHIFQAIGNGRSITTFYKLTYPLIVCGLNLLLLSTLCLVDTRRRALPA